MNDTLIKDFYSGNCFTAYTYFGAHLHAENNVSGAIFRTYAPRAHKVEVIGEFNNWCGETSVMSDSQHKGIYTLFIPHATEGMMYKYRIYTPDGRTLDKADPYAFFSELRPNTASIITDLESYTFKDHKWIETRTKNYDNPMNIYELHLGSWRKKTEEEGWYSYKELCTKLIDYLIANHFTHIEFLPLSEYPFDGSWGYQVSGYFSVTSRYGHPTELMYLIDECHKNHISVIMDFVPVHFVINDYALAKFDGTPLYEYEPSDVTLSEWGSCNFNYYRHEVCSFLQSAANFWIEVFHVDGLRFDAINNALYWMGESNRGINPGAVSFLKKLNQTLHKRYPNAILIAEDSSNFPKVTAPVEYGGLGFDYKWDLGWMNDTLKYFSYPPNERPAHHHELTFSMSYFYNELYLLPLSHDEVVHGKKTILDKMWGDYTDKFAQCRTLYVYMLTHPGKKLNFMGNEFAHFREWDEKRELDWNLLSYPMHDGFHRFIRQLNKLYITSPSLHIGEYNPTSFKWLDVDYAADATYSYIRTCPEQTFVIIINTSDKIYTHYKIGYPNSGVLCEILNSDATCFGGHGITNEGPIDIQKIPYKEYDYSFEIDLPAFGSCIFEIKA